MINNNFKLRDRYLLYILKRTNTMFQCRFKLRLICLWSIIILKKTVLYLLSNSWEVTHSYSDSEKFLKVDLTRLCIHYFAFIDFCFICSNLKKYCTYIPAL